MSHSGKAGRSVFNILVFGTGHSPVCENHVNHSKIDTGAKDAELRVCRFVCISQSIFSPYHAMIRLAPRRMFKDIDSS